MKISTEGVLSFIFGAVLGAVVATVVVTHSLQAEMITDQREASARGCKRGFAYGYAAREVWDAEAAAIEATLKPGQHRTAQRAIEMTRNESVKNIEMFRRRSAFAVASAVADSEPAKRMCGYY
jgi:hypothetical protein